MIVTKKHKLYVRDHKGVLRNLYKTAPGTYLEVILAFIEGDSNKVYSVLNKEAKVRKDFKPVPVRIDEVYRDEFKKLLREVHGADTYDFKKGKIVVSYNGSWQPLAELSLEGVKSGDVALEKGSKFDEVPQPTKKQETLIAIIAKNIETFRKWAKENELYISNNCAYAEDKNFKYVPVHEKEDTTGKRFDYYEVIEDWDGAAELIGIVETRLKKD
jgi:hypothetical protein